MPERVGGAFYELDLDARGYTAGAREAEAVKQRLVSGMRQVDTATAQTGRTVAVFGGGLKDVGRTAAAVALGMGGLSLAITGTRAALSGTLRAASDLNESMSKSRQVFREDAAAVEAWSRTSASAFGLSQRAALEAAGTFGNLFTAMQINRPEAARLSKSLVELAADLASFNNLRIEDVLISLRAGLVGEVEPLRRLGVAINEATVKQKAMQMGLAEGTDELSEAAKVQARYALILEQTGNAQGDFARTSDQLANRQRTLTATMANTGALIGQQLLPAVSAGTAGLTELLQVGNEVGQDVLPSMTQAAIALAAAFALIKARELAVALQASIAARVAAQRMLTAETFGAGPTVQVFTQSRLGALAATLRSPQVAVLGLTAAFIGLDVAVRKFTGSGIIAHLTGQAAAHRRAAEAAEAQRKVQEELAAIQREGVTADTARDALLLQEIRRVEQLEHAYNLARLEFERFLSSRSAPPIAAPLPGAGPSPITGPVFPDEELEQSANRIRALGLTYKQFLALFETHPRLGPFLKADADAARAAVGALAATVAEYEVAIKAAKEAQNTTRSALSDFLASVEDADLALNAQIEALKLEKLQLEQMKTAMGAAFGEGNETRLESLTRKLEVLEGQQSRLTGSVAAWGAEVIRQYGVLAPDAIRNVHALFLSLPTEEQIKLVIVLPDLVKIEAAFRAFIAALRAGATVDIAIRAGAASAFPTEQPTFLGGSITNLPGFQPGQGVIGDEAQRFIDEMNGKINDFNRNAIAPLGPSADKAAAGMSRLEKVLQAVADGTIDLAEAMELGLSDQEVVTLELAAADNELANQRFRERIELMTLARVFPGLTAEQVQYRLGLAAIAEHLRTTGQTVQQFLRDTARGVSELANAALGQIFGQPTRETLQAQLRLAELERKRLLLLAGGASQDDKRIEAIDREIEAARNALALRERELEILRIKTQLADQSIQTDIELRNAADFVRRIFEAMAAAGLRVVAMLSDLAGPIPSYQSGIPRVPRTGLALVHEGERITPAAESRMLGAGMAAPVFNQHFTVNADMSEAAMQRLADVVERSNERSVRRWRGSVLGSRGTN